MVLFLKTPPHFRLATTIRSHGWYDLAPFEFDPAGPRLHTALTDGERAIDVVIEQADEGRLAVRCRPADRAACRLVAQAVSEMLRLSEDLSDFYTLTDGQPGLDWARRHGGGRLLRAPTAFEDTVKMLLTTNCSWALTRVMTERLVGELGPRAPSGRRAFPTPATLAARQESWYREVVRAGYRSRYLVELAERVASGSVDLEPPRRHLQTPAASPPHGPSGTAWREALLALPGIGPYAADNLLRLYGVYDRLGIDSWCRAQLRPLLPRARNLDRAAERRYARFGRFAGLAMWVELTRRWHEPEQDPV
ncbi:MAG TPA: Fe-S cluster assembly protein HesB [Polyangia bacterium]|nr:Fe-S cluster assembly protein HesB [Polyangia bacterium]